MTRIVSIGLLVTGLTATAAAAQTPDARWNDWVGCWNLVADANVAQLPPAEDAAGGLAGPIRPGSGREARVCVTPSPGGAELQTVVGGQPVLTQTIVADGAEHPVNEGGCTGTQRAQWSADGLRLFTHAQVACDNQPQRTVTGLALIAPDGQWVDVQAVSIDGRDSVRVRRFRPPADRARSGVPAAAVRLQIDDVKEASKIVSPRAVEAALIETSARFPLSSRTLLDLDKAGVDDRVIDLMVALSYPRSFAIRPTGPDDRLTPFPRLLGATDFIDASYDYPYLYGPLYSNYYYSPYYYSPFAYSYLRFYGPLYSPAVIIPAQAGDGRGRNQPPEVGRVVNGLGYTRIDRRGDTSAVSAGDPVRRSGTSSTARVSPRGYTAGGESSTSSGSSGGTSSGGSTEGTASGGTRTAVPK